MFQNIQCQIPPPRLLSRMCPVGSPKISRRVVALDLDELVHECLGHRWVLSYREVLSYSPRMYAKYSSRWPTTVITIGYQNPNMKRIHGPSHRPSHLLRRGYRLEVRERKMLLAWWDVLFLVLDSEDPLDSLGSNCWSVSSAVSSNIKSDFRYTIQLWSLIGAVIKMPRVTRSSAVRSNASLSGELLPLKSEAWPWN